MLQKLKNGERHMNMLHPLHRPAHYFADFVFIDTEHIAIDRSDMARMCQ